MKKLLSFFIFFILISIAVALPTTAEGNSDITLIQSDISPLDGRPHNCTNITLTGQFLFFRAAIGNYYDELEIHGYWKIELKPLGSQDFIRTTYGEFRFSPQLGMVMQYLLFGIFKRVRFSVNVTTTGEQLVKEGIQIFGFFIFDDNPNYFPVKD